jgi:hypothetical protein
MLKQVVLFASLSVIAPLVIGLKHFRTYGNDLRALTVFLLFAGITELTSYLLWSRSMNNLPLLHVYTVIEFIMLSYIYRIHISSVLPRKFIEVTCLLFVCFAIYNSIFIQSVYQFNSYARGIEFIFILFYSIAYVYTLFTRNDTSPLKRTSMFWLNTGVLLYYTTSFFVFLLSNNMLMHLPKTAIQVSWAFHGIFLLIFHIFLSVALWIHPKQ